MGNNILKILTFNAGLLKIKLFGRTLVEPALFTDERFPYLSPALMGSGADLICLQEVYEKKHQARLISDLAPLYPFNVCAPSGRLGRLGPDLMMFSKYPIVASRVVLYRHLPPDERLCVDKGFIVAKVNAGPFGEICVTNTHNTSGGVVWHPEGRVTNRARHLQYRQLFKTIGLEQTDKRLAIGDFNCGPEATDKNYRELLAYGYADAWDQCHAASVPTWDPANVLNASGPHRHTSAQRMDHVLLNNDYLKNVRVVSAKIVFNEPLVALPDGRKVTLSDHYGFAAELQLI